LAVRCQWPERTTDLVDLGDLASHVDRHVRGKRPRVIVRKILEHAPCLRFRGAKGYERAATPDTIVVRPRAPKWRRSPERPARRSGGVASTPDRGRQPQPWLLAPATTSPDRPRAAAVA